MDNRTYSAPGNVINISGGDATNPLNGQFIIDNGTLNVDYQLSTSCPDTIILLKDVLSNGYFAEREHSYFSISNRTIEFAATSSAIILQNIGLLIRNDLNIRADSNTLVQISNVIAWAKVPLASPVVSSLDIRLYVGDAMAGSFVRDFHIIADSAANFNAIFRYEFPSGVTDASVKVVNMDVRARDVVSQGSIQIEGAANDTLGANGGIYVASSSAGNYIYPNMTLVMPNASGRATFTGFDSSTTTILRDPIITHNRGYGVLFPQTGGLEVQRSATLGVGDSSTGNLIPNVRVRLYNGTHVFHSGISFTSGTTGYLATVVLQGVYTVAQGGGSRRERITFNAVIRKYGYVSQEITYAIPSTGAVAIETRIPPDPSIRTSETDIDDTAILLISFAARTIRLIDTGDDHHIRPYHIYDYYKYLINLDTNMMRDDLFSADGRHLMFSGSDWRIDINHPVIHEDEGDIGYLLESEGDIRVTSTVQCSLMVKYTRSSVDYSSILLRVSSLGGTLDLDNHKMNVSYFTTVSGTETRNLISSDIELPNRIDNLGLIQFRLADTNDNANENVFINYVDTQHYLTSTKLPTEEVEGTVQTLSLVPTPGFDGLSYADLETNYNTITATGTWTWTFSGAQHNLVITDAGNITWANIAQFFRYYEINNMDEFASVDYSFYTYTGNTLSYPNMRYTTNGTTAIDGGTVQSIFDIVDGTNAHSNDISGTVRITVSNDEIQSIKVKVVNSANGAVLQDFVTTTGKTYSSFIEDDIEVRAVVYAEGYKPIIINFNTAVNTQIFTELDAEINIDYTADIGAMDIEDANNIITTSSVPGLFTVFVTPLTNIEYILDRDESRTFFGKLKASNDYLNHMVNHNVNDFIHIDRTQVSGNQSEFNMRRGGTATNVAAVVKLFTFFDSDIATFNSSDSNNKIIEFESSNESVDILDLEPIFGEKRYLTESVFLLTQNEGRDG